MTATGRGRSSVLHAGAGEASEQGLDVLRAGGSELERGYGFGVVRQMLEARIAALTCGERRALLTAGGPATRLRLVTHLDVDRPGCERAVAAMRNVLG